MRRERLKQALEVAFERIPALREELGGAVLSLSLSQSLSASASSASKEREQKQQTQTQKETRRCLAAALRSAAFLAVGDCEQAIKVIQVS